MLARGMDGSGKTWGIGKHVYNTYAYDNLYIIQYCLQHLSDVHAYLRLLLHCSIQAYTILGKKVNNNNWHAARVKCVVYPPQSCTGFQQVH